MTSPYDTPGALGLDTSIREVVDAIQNATRLLRTLAPLRAQWQALDAAIVEFGQAAVLADQPHIGFPSATAPVTPDASADASPTASAEPHLHMWMPPTPPGFVPADAESGSAGGSPASTQHRQLTIVVTRQDAPLDLVRAHGALEHVDGVESLVLASYTRGRAALHAEVSRPPEQLALIEALRAAFDDAVSIVEESEDTLTLSIGEPAPAL